MRDFFPILELKGKPYEMGKTHGRTLAKEIKANLELYFMMIQGLTGLEPQQCLTHASRVLEVIQKDASFLLEEMEGIARGAEVSLKEILFLIKGLELMPQVVKEIDPADGVVLHTNHYCDAELAKKDVGRLLMTDSFARLNRAAALISKRQLWDDQSLAEIFSNHDDAPGSICRHTRAEDAEHFRIATVASCIIDLTATKMQVSFGQPCGAPYRELALP